MKDVQCKIKTHHGAFRPYLDLNVEKTQWLLWMTKNDSVKIIYFSLNVLFNL